MYFIGNNNGELLCKPGTNSPYIYDTEEEAQAIIKSLKLDNATVLSDINDQEERYGGQDDLW